MSLLLNILSWRKWVIEYICKGCGDYDPCILRQFYDSDPPVVCPHDVYDWPKVMDWVELKDEDEEEFSVRDYN